MGVQQFLSQVLPVAGRKVDLRDFREGILPGAAARQTASSNSRRRGRRGRSPSDDADDDDDDGKRRPLRIGLDAGTWIYKACVGHGNMLADERYLSNYGRAELHLQVMEGSTARPVVPAVDAGVVTTYVTTCAKYVTDRILDLKRESNAEVLVVMDGASPPVKAAGEGAKRSKKRKEAEQARDGPVDVTGSELEQEKRIAGFKQAGAGEYYGQVQSEILKSLRENKIPFLVSPYEADGQLAYLINRGWIDLIVTEDSDMMAYDGSTPVLYKLSDSLASGEPKGTLLRWEDLVETNVDDGKLDLSDFSPCMLAVLFVSVGCDYCTKLMGIGITTACKIVRSAFFENHPRKNRSGSSREGANKAPLEVVFEGLFRDAWDRDLSSEDLVKYREDFLSALVMYRHPVVYDPVQRVCIRVREKHPDPELAAYRPYRSLVEDAAKCDQISGSIVASPMATYIAEGWISPKSKRPFDSDDLPEHVKQFIEGGGCRPREDGDGGDPAATPRQGDNFDSAAAGSKRSYEGRFDGGGGSGGAASPSKRLARESSQQPREETVDTNDDEEDDQEEEEEEDDALQTQLA